MALDLNDKTGNGYNLSNQASVTEVTTNLPFGGSTSAAGFAKASSQYLYDTDPAGLELASDITFEAWVKFNTLPENTNGNRVVLFTKDDGTKGYKATVLEKTNDSSEQWQISFVYRDGSTTNVVQPDIPSLSTGTWYHIALIWDNTAADLEIIWNGSSIGSTAGTGAISAWSNSADFRLGSEATAASNLFDGVMDDARLWTAVRTESEVSNNKDYELTGTETNLLAYWPFEATLNPKVADSGNPIFFSTGGIGVA